MTGRKTRLGLLALFMVAVVGSAQTMAFLMDEENAEIRFAANAAGNTTVGSADTDWGTGAGNQAVSPGGPTDAPANPDDGERSIDGPPPGVMAVGTPAETAGPMAPPSIPGDGTGGAGAGPAPADGPVLDVDPPPPVPPPT